MSLRNHTRVSTKEPEARSPINSAKMRQLLEMSPKLPPDTRLPSKSSQPEKAKSSTQPEKANSSTIGKNLNIFEGIAICAGAAIIVGGIIGRSGQLRRAGLVVALVGVVAGIASWILNK